MRSKKLKGIAVIGLLCSLASSATFANSVGSPVCEVPFIPFAPMSNVIGSPAPIDWRLSSTAKFYRAGEQIEVRIVNSNPLKTVRGVLIWARFAGVGPAGSFLVGPGKLWQYIPPGPDAQCAQASVTHTSASPKPQSELVFNWTPPAQGDVLMRAFLIEDCLLSGCRSFQALTQILELPEAFLVSGFE